MHVVRLIALLTLGVALSACARIETVSRNSAPEQAVPAPVAMPFDIVRVDVRVPRSLRVSEANAFLPMGDIVWREDPPGDRYAQVAAIVHDGLSRGLASLQPGGVPAVLDVEVSKFHALSEKARYTFGGVHALQFTFVLRNPATGEAYGAPQFVKADFRALGGAAAIAAERKGLTQKVRITRHLAKVIREELTDPQGHVPEGHGLIGALNQI